MQNVWHRHAKKVHTAVLITVLLCSFCIFPQRASAAQLSPRSLFVLDNNVRAVTTHRFTFNYVNPSASVGVVEILYCTSPLESLPCVAPNGLDASAASLASQSGESGFTLNSTTANSLILTRTAAVPNPATSSSYTFNGVRNPDPPEQSFYARIHTYTNLGDPSYIDFGSVVNATAHSIFIQGEVPPILKFCVGVTIPGDCSTAEGNIVELGNMSTAFASSGTSQMQVGTNAEFGVAIAVYGTTMTSGNNSLPALTAPTASAPGASQFGLNLRQNTIPNVGTDVTMGFDAHIVPTARYNIMNRYTFASGDTIAVSSRPTNMQTLTASYLANISRSQAPGVYTATMTYICTAMF